MKSYKHFHNIVRFFDILPNFIFTTSEKMRDYYFQTWHLPDALTVVEQLKFRILKN